MSTSSSRRSGSKVVILRLVGVLAFVAFCNHGITRYSKGSTDHDVLLQRKLAGALIWRSEDTFWGFRGIFPQRNASNEQAKGLSLDTSFLAFNSGKEQETSLEPKTQNPTFMTAKTSNEQAKNLALDTSFLAFNPSKEQEMSLEPKFTKITFISANTSNKRGEENLEEAPETFLSIAAVPTSDGQEESQDVAPQMDEPESAEMEPEANMSAESATSVEQEESSEAEPEIQRCLRPATPPPMPGKKGACFTLRDEGKKGSWLENLPKVIALKPYWNYSWGSKRIAMQPENIEFVPMLWGAWGSEGLERRITTDILPQIESGQAKRLLGFNEPDFEKQSNLSVDEVTSYWPILAKIDLPLASPSVGHATGRWMVEFMQKTEESCLRMEYIAVHWYGGPNAAGFKNKMREAYTLYGSWRPMLITEFAVADWDATSLEENRHSTAEVLAFMKNVLPWMEEPEQYWIAGYSWFSFDASAAVGTSSALFDDDGSVTKLGRYYASVTTENPTGDQSI
jgi:hypothetical protein